ncbi:family 43 glycosylhydrolase [Viridibacterium curvum]
MPLLLIFVLLAGLLAGWFLARRHSPAMQAAVTPALPGVECVPWARGIEGQRKADLGDGRYLNPIMPGDHPDPSILKDGDDYYMTFSSFDAYPGLVIWHSRDLVNWQPVTAALKQPIGSVWAPELIKHEGRYYLYIPTRLKGEGLGGRGSIHVIWADDIRGPWSDPVDLGNPRIDPGHAVGEDGKRYLFLSGGGRVQLSDDGLSIVGEMEHVYDGWAYPEEWDVEAFAQEGPKITRHGEYFYMVLAEGGTAGPATGHMVICARSRSIHGPWENAPHNPILRTRSSSEAWWSRGHATLVEGPTGAWYMVYHAYEKGYYNLGRQTLLEPIEWTSDGWFRAVGGDVAQPLPMPVVGRAVPHGQALSDDFSTDRMGVQWGFYDPQPGAARHRYDNGALVIEGRGSSPADCSPLTCVTGDRAYRFEVELDIDEGAQGGVLLFYSRRLYVGLGLNANNLVMHRYGTERVLARPAHLIGRRVFMRVSLRDHVVTIHTSSDGQTWHKFGTQMEVSGYHHNVAFDFLSLRPGFYAAGSGEVRFRNFRFEALRD